MTTTRQEASSETHAADVEALRAQVVAAKTASAALGRARTAAKNAALKEVASLLRARSDEVCAANAEDV